MAGEKSSDDVFLLLFFIVVLWGGGWLVWSKFRAPITSGILAVRTVQMDVASLWMNDDDVIEVPIARATDDEKPLKAKLGDNERVEQFTTTFGTWRQYAKATPAEKVTNDHLFVLSYVAMYVWRIPAMLALIGLALWALFNGPTSKFRRIMGLESLMFDQSKMFSVIKPFLKFNPNKLPIRGVGSPVPKKLPAFAEALAPEEWLAINEIPETDKIPDREKTERAFAKQLGPRWKGHNALPPELRVLLACFCLKASRHRDQADEMLGRLACCWDHDTGLKLSRDRALLSDAKKILRNKKLSESTIASCNRHAYVSTAMMRALNTARSEGGVLASSQFVWLRAHNRELWYPLNNLGRQAFHMEALGVCSHYRAEKQINRPIVKPRVADAFEGLRDYQTNAVLYRAQPALDDGGKKHKQAA